MDYNSASSAGAQGLFAGIFFFFFIFAIAVSLLVVISGWKIFEKAGKPGWASLIPIYNLIVWIEIVGKPTIWILWLLIPCVNIVFAIWLTNLVSKSFGKSEGYTVGLLLFPWLFYPMLAFGSSRYLGPSAAEANGGFNPNGFNPNGFNPNAFNPNDPNNKFGGNNPFNQPPTPPAPPTPPTTESSSTPPPLPPNA